MRKMLFFCLLFPCLAIAQLDDYDLAFNKHKPDSLTRPIHMPMRDYNPTFRYDDSISYNKKIRVLVVTDDAVYKKMFWRYVYTNDSLEKYKKTNPDKWISKWIIDHHVDSLPVIDFSKNELLMYAACSQCLAYCKHSVDDKRSSCHRNVCHFRETWFIREKKTSGSATN